ncbi:FkbM family methyltransferase [Parvibaculum indicum]|nr:FkbM family methyltransferase [Parvibaculum indicum]NIJ43429.1 FkbM family methyltransferase [Parvibaculum indicum]
MGVDFSKLQRIEVAIGSYWAFENDLITDQLLEFGAHTRNELAMLMDHVRPGFTVVDIGAHIGTYAVPIARKIGAAGKLLAIEGSSETFEVLTLNICVNELLHTVQCRNEILCDSDTASFERTNTKNNTGAGAFLPSSDGVYGTEAYRCLLLSGFAKPDLIKIDVEGMECAILRSIQPILRAVRPILYIEVVKEQLERTGGSRDLLQELLEPHGYNFYRNVGERNSSSDTYQMVKLETLADGGDFFDLLALPTGP